MGTTDTPFKKGDRVRADGHEWVVVGRTQLPSKDGGTREYIEVKQVIGDDVGSSISLYRPESLVRA